MRKLMLMGVALLAAVTSMAMSLVEARGKIAIVIANPSEATAVVRQLSASDQKAFLAEVNGQIAKLPGSAEERSAKANVVNRNALKGTAKGNAAVLIAEVFASAPVESLTVINESFAKDVLNRAANPKRVYTDAEFVDISKNIMSKVNERLTGSADAGVRGGFAVLMMVRASNGSPATLANDLADTLGASAQIAKTEWFPAALAATPDYGPMLASTESETPVPDVKLAVLLTGPQQHFALLSSIMSGAKDALDVDTIGFGDWSQIQSVDHDLYTLPRTIEAKPWNPDIPRGYDWQNTGR